jgi:serine/threonine-protein kinase mTOR
MYDQVPDLLDNLWTGLRDTKVAIREAAATAFSRCLAIASQREGQLYQDCLLMVFEQAQRGFKINTPDAVHGSLLGYQELFSKSGMVGGPSRSSFSLAPCAECNRCSLCNPATSKFATR